MCNLIMNFKNCKIHLKYIRLIAAPNVVERKSMNQFDNEAVAINVDSMTFWSNECVFASYSMSGAHSLRGNILYNLYDRIWPSG